MYKITLGTFYNNHVDAIYIFSPFLNESWKLTQAFEAKEVKSRKWSNLDGNKWTENPDLWKCLFRPSKAFRSLLMHVKLEVG